MKAGGRPDASPSSGETRGLRASPGRREVVLLVPEHLVAVEEVALVGHVEAVREIRGRDRIDEQLEAHERLAGIAQVLADDRGEVAAGRVAGDGEPARVGPQAGGVGMRPARRVEGVVGGGGKTRLGRQPVADVQDDGRRRVGERPADRVVGVDGAEQPAASVEVDDERPDARLRIRPDGRNVRQSRHREWRSSARRRHRRARRGRARRTAIRS